MVSLRDQTAYKRMQEDFAEGTRLLALSADVGRALTTGAALPATLQRCAEVMVQHLDAAFARIWTLNSAENVLELQASAGLYTHLDGPHGRVPVGKFKIGWIAQERKPHLTNDVIGDSRVNNQEWAKREGMVAFAGYPLVVENTLVGVMAMFARQPLQEATLRAFAAVADQVAVGIKRQWSATELYESEERFRAAFAHASVGMAITDLQGRFLQVNAAYCAILGYSAQEILAADFVTRTHPEDVPRDTSLLRQMMAGEIPGFVLEKRYLQKDGGVVWVQNSVSLARDSQGEPTSIIALTENITDRKRTEAEGERLMGQVQAERTRLRTVLEQMPAGVFLAEAPSGRLLFANREAERIYHLPNILAISAEEWTQWKAYRLDGSLLLPQDYPLARALTEGVTTQDDVYIIERGNGSRTTLLVNAAPIREEQGTIVAGVAAFYDISDRIHHQQEIETLNARLRRSVQETHHRVKNNLQVISALAELQVEAGEETVPVAALKRIGQHTRSLAAIHDLLTQEAKVNVEADSISAEEALNKLIPLLQATAGGRRIRCRTEDFRLPVREGASLALLVSELVSNAVKHGRNEIDLSLIVEEGMARLEVSDDGPGFPADFDWRMAANTGLGLIDSTGRHDLRGSISYENRPEGGAQVVVLFPVPA